MSARDDGLTGEVMPPEGGPEACLYHCECCGRLVMNEAVFVTDAGALHCAGCQEVINLDDDI